MELADILSSLRRRWRIAVAVLLLTGAVIAAFLRHAQRGAADRRRYRAEADLLVPDRDDKSGSFPEGVPPGCSSARPRWRRPQSARREALENAGVPAEQLRADRFGYTTE